MLTLKRALIIAGLILFIFFYASPRRSTDLEANPLSGLKSVRGGPRPTLQESRAPDASKIADTSRTESASEGKATSKSNTDPSPFSAILTGDADNKLVKTEPQTQVAMGNMKDQPLRTQLAYQFPYDVSAKFPAFIWQTWKYTPANPKFGDNYRVAEATWTEKHPDFIHEVITDQVALHLVRHLYSAIPQVLEAYNALPAAIYKADFFRYLILLARGGIYSDIDTLAIKPATSWLPGNFRMTSIGLVIGIEADPDREDWADWYSRRIQFCQWTIQSKPGHPVLREIVAQITEETLRRKGEGKLKKSQIDVVEFTGPARWTDTIFQYFNDDTFFDTHSSVSKINWANFTGMTYPKKLGDVVVLPITSFSPGIGHSGARDVDDPMAFVKHEFEGTWKPDSERHIGIIIEAPSSTTTTVVGTPPTSQP